MFEMSGRMTYCRKFRYAPAFPQRMRLFARYQGPQAFDQFRFIFNAKFTQIQRFPLD